MINLYNTKIAFYLGSLFTVPNWVNYMTIDGDDEVYGYENEPFIDGWGNTQNYFWDVDLGNSMLVGYLPDPYRTCDWEKSLRRVKAVSLIELAVWVIIILLSFITLHILAMN